MRENKEAHVRERGQGRSDAFKEQCLSHVLKWGPLWKEKEWGYQTKGKSICKVPEARKCPSCSRN